MASDELLLVVLAFVGLGIVCWYLLQKQSALAKARLQRVESINRLIEKFSTAKEIIEFLETEQGKKLMADPLPPTGNPRMRVLRFVRYGVVSLFLGGGFFVIAYSLRGGTDPNYVRQAMDMQAWGIFSVALGMGLLVVAFLTNTLIKNWGLDNGQ